MSEQDPRDAQEPPKLDYARPEEGRVGRMAAASAGGFVLGVTIIVFAGFGVFTTSASGTSFGPGGPVWWAVAMFFVLTAGSAAGIVAIALRPPRRYFFIGMLLGIGVMSLIEGVCFVNP